MPEARLRAMEKKDWSEVTDLIYVSTNYWYQTNGKPPIFSGGPQNASFFCKIYEHLDPGCCVVAESPDTGRLMGSCFYHPRETHVSLGIMNVHPNYFGAGVARKLLQFICAFADREKKPLRLVSSAMNLDSFSLYNRAGFVPRCVYQDLIISVPESGLKAQAQSAGKLRAATSADVDALAELELSISHISRKKDYRYFIENPHGNWHVSVLEGAGGKLEGFLASMRGGMLGPGVARTQDQAAALILAELNQQKGCKPVFLVPVECSDLVKTLYGWGAKNCELHFAQVRGECKGFNGITMPTFMPETA